MEPLLLDVPEAIDTDRLHMRCPRAGDGEAFFDSITESAAHLRAWLVWPDELSTRELCERKMRERRAEWLRRELFHFLVLEKSSSALVGSVVVAHVEWKVPKCELGYWIVEKYGQKGYATEATRAAADFAFDALGMRRVQIRCEPANAWSRRVAERAGFVCEATLKNDIPPRDGDVRDAIVYAMTR